MGQVVDKKRSFRVVVRRFTSAKDNSAEDNSAEDNCVG
jgi:hypothetical protein